MTPSTTPLLTTSDSIAALQSALKRSFKLPPRPNATTEQEDEESSLLRNLQPMPDGDISPSPPPHSNEPFDLTSSVHQLKPPTIIKAFQSKSEQHSIASDLQSIRTFQDQDWPPVPTRTAAVEQASNCLRVFSAAANQPHQHHHPYSANAISGALAGALPPHEQAVLTLKLVKVLCAKHRQVKSLKAALRQQKHQASRQVSTVQEEGSEDRSQSQSQTRSQQSRTHSSPAATPPPSRPNSTPIRRDPPIRARPPRPHVMSCAVHTPGYAPHGVNYESIGSYPAPRLYHSTALSTTGTAILGSVCRVSSVTPPKEQTIAYQLRPSVNEMNRKDQQKLAAGAAYVLEDQNSRDSSVVANEEHIVNDLRDLRLFIDTLRQDLRTTLAADLTATAAGGTAAKRQVSKKQQHHHHSDERRQSSGMGNEEGITEKENGRTAEILHYDQQTQTSPVAGNRLESSTGGGQFSYIPPTVPRPSRYSSYASGYAPELGLPPSPRPMSPMSIQQHSKRSPRPGTRVIPVDPEGAETLPRPRLSVFCTEPSEAARIQRPPWAIDGRHVSDYDAIADERRRRYGVERYFAELKRSHHQQPKSVDDYLHRPIYGGAGPPDHGDYTINYSSTPASHPAEEGEYSQSPSYDVLSPSYRNDRPSRYTTDYNGAVPPDDEYYMPVDEDNMSPDTRRRYSADVSPGRDSDGTHEYRREGRDFEPSEDATPAFAEQVEIQIRLQTSGSTSEQAHGLVGHIEDVVEPSPRQHNDSNGEISPSNHGGNSSPVGLGTFESPAERYRQLNNLPAPTAGSPHRSHSRNSSPSASPQPRDYRRLLRPVAGSPTSDGQLSPLGNMSPGSVTTSSPVSPARSADSPMPHRRSQKGVRHRARLDLDPLQSPMSPPGSPMSA